MQVINNHGISLLLTVKYFFLGLFIRHADPLYIKTKKLEILTTIASDSNVEEVVTELR